MTEGMGLGSIYLSPNLSSDVIHVIVDEDYMLCLPRVPLGRWEPRPDAPAPTCPTCIRKGHHGR